MADLAKLVDDLSLLTVIEASRFRCECVHESAVV